MTKLQFIAPQSKNPIDIQFSQNYKRKLKAYENNYLKILEPEWDERRQMKHWTNRALAKPEHIKRTLVRAWKVALNEGEYEDDDSNIITGKDAPKIGFHYVIHEVIDNPKSRENGNPPWAFPLSTDTYEVGVYMRPQFELSMNAMGDVTKSTVVTGFKCHYLKFDEKEVKKVLEMQRDPTFQMVVLGYDKVPRSVKNEREWIEGDITDLVNANRGIGLGQGQTYLTVEYGGLNRYLKDKAEKIKAGQQQQNDNTKDNDNTKIDKRH